MKRLYILIDDDTRLGRFADRIERGSVLVVVDVPRERFDEIRERVRANVPEAQVEDIGPPGAGVSLEHSSKERAVRSEFGSAIACARAPG